jgi:hypothetical protein
MRTGYGSPTPQRAPRKQGTRATYNGYIIQRYRSYARYWALYDSEGELVCLTVYRKGAEEVVRRLQMVVDRATRSQTCELRQE